MSDDRKHESDEVQDAGPVNESALPAVAGIAYLTAAGLSVIALYYGALLVAIVGAGAVFVLGYVMYKLTESHD